MRLVSLTIFKFPVSRDLTIDQQAIWLIYDSYFNKIQVRFLQLESDQ